jgi:hypothetical protein
MDIRDHQPKAHGPKLAHLYGLQVKDGFYIFKGFQTQTTHTQTQRSIREGDYVLSIWPCAQKCDDPCSASSSLGDI